MNCRDMRNDKCNPILYFRLLKNHKKYAGENPVNIWQIMKIVGTEAIIEEYKTKIAPEDITFIRLKDFCNINVKPFKPSVAELDHYPWYKLAESIKKNGLVIPIIAELYQTNNSSPYLPLEGKHRLVAATMVEPFDLNRLLPCVTVEYDYEFTYKMFGQPHPRYGGCTKIKGK